MPDRYLGQNIGKYRVVRLLGVGAFSWVYEAVDRDLEIAVALKILRPEFAGAADAEERFRREATLAARLRHRHIVTVRDVGRSDGAVFVAMDLLPLSLGRRLAVTAHLPETECIRLGLHIAAALAMAHAGGVIHRDIKPDNILLTPEGDAVVADFGLAQAVAGDRAADRSQRVLGTPHYFSPEQARGLPLDGRSDLYSLGVTLFRAATGRLPFEGEDWFDVATQHVESAPPSPRTLVPELSPDFEALILRLLAKDPEARFATALQAADALAALPAAPGGAANGATPHLGALTVEAFPPIRLRTQRRRRLALALGAAAAAVVVWVTTARLRTNADAANDGVSLIAPSDMLAATPSDSALRSDLRLPLRSAAESLAALLRPDNATPPPDTLPLRVPVLTPPPTRRTTRLELTAPDSAQLYVDNQLVGRGRWSGERPAAARTVLRAVLDDAPLSCDAAARDSIVRLAAGDQLAIHLVVRPCIELRYTIGPRDARFALRPIDGGPTIEVRADSAQSLSVPAGRYAVRASANRCYTFVDTITVARQPEGAPMTGRIRLDCN